MPDKIRVAVVGLQFGPAFVPIYQKHLDVTSVAACDVDAVAPADYDAMHLLMPGAFHVEQTLVALAAGKHCACAVPMAFDLDDLHRIVAAPCSPANWPISPQGSPSLPPHLSEVKNRSARRGIIPTRAVSPSG